MPNTKIDFKKTFDSYKAKHNKFRVIEVPKMQYLMVDGHGDPNTSNEFQNALEALYPIAYKLKFFSKLELKKDYVVAPLEGLWWSENMETFTTARDKSQWDWTMMLMVPGWITRKMFEDVKDKVKVKIKIENKELQSLDKVRLEELDEGLCVQTLHIGSYDDEGSILDEMHHKFIPENGYKMVKKHHEIYFSDFRIVAKEKLRTILRQPVERV